MQILDAVPAAHTFPAAERPSLPPVETQEHPIGGIRLWTAGALGRRANALSGGGDSALMLSHSPWETMTWTSRDGNTDF
ncbi:hypothetical protein [Streptacidiphilus anmyonensis]|uniref:hypothetical protein n=1 Tax=Streptacidiphilus anmyonensis TaxID=405782 RepID=UPI0005A80660|nr:hypothetical protein [Streptacidiphilus anmyonensis]